MKTERSINQYLYAGFLALFLLGLAAPSVVFADDGAPAEPAAEATQEMDDPAAEPETSPVEPAAEETLPEETSDVMQAIPEGTDLVVLDENGEALPLGSLEAEQVIQEGDPMWCPVDVLPGGAGCTASATSFLGDNGLLALLWGKSGTGTIYVSYDYNAITNEEDFDQSIVLDHFSDKRLKTLGNLTIQGGWDFNSNALNESQPYSVFNFGTGSFSIVNWTGNIQIKNIRLEDTTGGSLYGGALAIINPTTGGDVLLQDVTVIHSGGHEVDGVANERSGAYINTKGNVTINNSYFTGNLSTGLRVSSHGGGRIDLTGVEASENEGKGILISTTGDVLVKNSKANSNLGDGLNIFGDEEGEPGDYTISCSTFNSNTGTGVQISVGNNVYLWGIEASLNGDPNIFTAGILGGVFESPDCDGGACVCQPADDADVPPALQGVVVPVVGNEKVALECGYAWTMLKLGSQDTAKFSGLCGGQLSASLSSFSGDNLPGPLPEGGVMGSGIEAGVDGAVILPDGGWMQISFNIPADLEGKTLSILFWDAAAGEWVSLPLFGEGGFAASDAAMQVLTGVQVNADGTVTATVNFGGTFVLMGV